MRRSVWAAVAGFGVAGWIVAAPGARAGDEKSGSTATGGTQQGGAPAASTKAKAPEGNLSGKVEKYDRANRTLSLASSGKKLKVTDDTEVFKNGDRVSPGQIMEGDEVRASFTGSGDTLEVVRIDVTATPAPGSTGPKKVR